MLLPALPVSVLFIQLPVALILAEPVRVSASTWEPSVWDTEA